MKPALNLFMFNWEVFLKVITPLRKEIAERIVEELIENESEEDPDAVGHDLFQQEQTPVEIVCAIISADNWYEDDLEIFSETRDEIVIRLFTSLWDEPGLELESIGTQVPSDLSELIAGWEEVVSSPAGGTMLHTRAKCKYDIDRETRWLGWRPFRSPGWKKTIPLDRNPSKLLGSYEIPLYSIHTPEEVQKLYEEAAEYEDEINSLSSDIYIEMFNDSYLDGLEVAARNKMGLFCWLND